VVETEAEQDGERGERQGGRPPPLRAGAPAPCPDCGGERWFVGRRSAECAGCGAPVPLAEPSPLGAAGPRTRYGLPLRLRRRAA
jgi:uncharacterized protein (DUF983 family)